MGKQNFFAAEYVAPELDVISTVVEAGFSASSSIDDAYGDAYGEY